MTNSDNENAPVHWQNGFWNGLDAKYLVGTMLAVGALIIPATQFLGNLYKAEHDRAQLQHQQRIDLVSQLMKAQTLADERQRVLARRDVLRMLAAASAADDPVGRFAVTELPDVEAQLKALLDLQVAEASAAIASAPKSPDPNVAAQVNRARAELAKRLVITSKETPRQPTPAPPTKCLRSRFEAPGGIVDSDKARSACAAAFTGTLEWQVNVGAVLVRCVCEQAQ